LKCGGEAPPAHQGEGRLKTARARTWSPIRTRLTVPIPWAHELVNRMSAISFSAAR
jgi:hypothetical protein